MNPSYKNRLPADFPEDLLEAGISLRSAGLSEIGWKRDEAMRVVEVFAERGYAILGGDVLVEKNGMLTHTYDNWFINKEEEPFWDQFVLDSKDRALSYIRRYSEAEGADTYYTIVFESATEGL